MLKYVKHTMTALKWMARIAGYGPLFHDSCCTVYWISSRTTLRCSALVPVAGESAGKLLGAGADALDKAQSVAEQLAILLEDESVLGDETKELSVPQVCALASLHLLHCSDLCIFDGQFVGLCQGVLEEDLQQVNMVRMCLFDGVCM
jgi:hypothetical protein